MLSTSSFNISAQILIFIVEIIVARILIPEDFGAFMMALITVELISILSQKHIVIGYMHKQETRDSDLSSITFFAITLSLICTLLAYLSLDTIKDIWNEDIFNVSFATIAWLVPIVVLENIYRLALLKKGLYWQMGAAELFSVIFYAIALIFLAWQGFGLYALLYAYIIRQMAKIAYVLYYFIKEYRIFAGIKIKIIKNHLWMSWGFTLQSLFLFSTNNTDKYFASLAAGSAGLGLYSRALKLLQMPLNQIARNISLVLFVEFSKKQDDHLFISENLRLTILSISLIFIPIAIVLNAFAEEIITLVYGKNWAEMVPLFEVLVFGAVISSISIVLGDYLKSQGIIYRELISNALALIVLATSAYLLYPNIGITGVAVAYLLGQLTHFIVQIYIVNKSLKTSKKLSLKLLLIPFILASLTYTIINIFLISFSELSSLILTTIFLTLFFATFSYLYKNKKQKVKTLLLNFT